MRKGYLQNCRRFLYYHSFAIVVGSNYYCSHLVEDVWIFCVAFKDTNRKKIGNYDFMRNLFLLTYFLSDLMKVELSLEPCLHIQDKLSKPPWIFNVILWDFCKPRSHQITSSYVWLYCPSMPPTDQYTSTAYGLFVYIHQKKPVIYTCLIIFFYL